VGRNVNRAKKTAQSPWATRSMSKYRNNAHAILTDSLRLIQ